MVALTRNKAICEGDRATPHTPRRAAGFFIIRGEALVMKNWVGVVLNKNTSPNFSDGKSRRATFAA
ncbi:MAG: hypothetical protein KME46_21390 [Brasilonema angustatum HA4187-MV1]|jgi:hypothetical protein|nr:hypothetical protein [Brasilonema angustatum HA4187-MV1]